MLKALDRIIQEVNKAKNLSTALSLIVQSVCEVTHADASSIFLLDHDQSEYVLAATSGLKPRLVNKLKIKFGEGLVGLVGNREMPVNICNALTCPESVHEKDLNLGVFNGFLGVPIIQQNELLGVLIAQKPESTCFNTNEEAILLTLMVQLSELIAASKAKEAIEKISKTKKGMIFNGNPCVLGVGIGTIAVIYPTADLDAIPDKESDDPETEVADFIAALKAAHDEILILEKTLAHIPKEERILFEAYAQILASPSLKKEVIKEIRAGNWAPGALKRVIQNRISQFAAMDDAYLRERAQDLRDLGQRVLTHLQTTDYKPPTYPAKTVLVGEEITPAVIAEVPVGQLKGIVSTKGAQNSHVAILARALGIPTIMGIPDLPLPQLENKKAIIDGYYGQFYVSPSRNILKEFKILAAQEQELDLEVTKLANLPAKTSDGHHVALMINTGLAIDLQKSTHVGAEGVGLYRTELPFLTRDYFPPEEEQKNIYQRLLKSFAPLPVTMRTLDVGGDKMLSYLTVKEANPYLGWRGVRLTLDHPEIFLIQIKAMLRANIDYNNLQIMLPMITSIKEIERSMRLINQAYNELKEEHPNIVKPPIGVMIEVPSAIYQGQDIARHVDFLSVGSNDLTQYLLAVDRNNARVSDLYDSLHPAMLRALIQIVTAAHQENKKITICGEMAGDPTATFILLAIGFDALSMNANQILRIKWLIRKGSMKLAKKLLKEVMQMDDATEIRYHMEAALEELGAAGLIRAGK